MKKLICLSLICILLFSVCSCNIITTDKNTIGKAANTAVTVYTALEENFTLREMTGYSLYGIHLRVNSENVGTYTYVYTNKRPDDMSYSDILVVEVNNRTGRIEKFSSPDYETYAEAPYDMIKTAMPLDPSSFAVDSDAAMKTATKTHFGNNFIYNYVDTRIVYENGAYIYDIDHISLVNNCVYNTVIDAMTGAVITSGVEELE